MVFLQFMGALFSVILIGTIIVGFAIITSTILKALDNISDLNQEIQRLDDRIDAIKDV